MKINNSDDDNEDGSVNTYSRPNGKIKIGDDTNPDAWIIGDCSEVRQ